jgi:hypothetical protein
MTLSRLLLSLPQRNQLRTLQVPTPTIRIQKVTLEADMIPVVALDIVETTMAVAKETVNSLLHQHLSQLTCSLLCNSI